MQQSAQPPPPPPPSSKLLTGFHLPGTNLFPGIRSQLTALERSSRPLQVKSPVAGFLWALIFAALASMGLSFVVELPFLSSVGIVVTSAVFAPLLEEPLKALGILVAVLFVWKTVPNRRYGAALGAAAGLGFGISESIIYIAVTPTVGMFLTRVIVTCMHPVWSAFVGMGFFAMGLGKVGHASLPNRSEFSMLLLFSLGVANHMVWNSLSIAFSLAGIGLIGLLLDIFVIFPLFLIVLRDLLGGHFNFQNFFEPLETPTLTHDEIPPPPPPPP